MADKKKEEATPAAEAAAGDGAKKKGGMKMIIAAVAVVVLEILTVGVTMKMSSGPKKVIADVPTTQKAEAHEKDAEVKVFDGRFPNNLGGRLYLYDLQVVAKVSEKDKEKVTEAIAEREAEIRDQIRTIIASSDPKSLSEPGLETLRRQISYQLEHDVGKDLLKEVLLPRCTPIRVEY